MFLLCNASLNGDNVCVRQMALHCCVLGNTVLCGDCVVTVFSTGDGVGSFNIPLQVPVILNEGLRKSAVTRLIWGIAQINVVVQLHRYLKRREKALFRTLR